MAGDDAVETNSRVTTREFYEMQLKIREDMNNGFDTVKKDIAAIDKVTVAMSSKLDDACELAKDNRNEITSIKRRSNALDAGVLVISAIWTGIVTIATGSNK